MPLSSSQISVFGLVVIATVLSQFTLYQPFALGDALEARGFCNHDNCLRELSANSAQASPFCSNYLKASATATSKVTFTSSCTENPTAVSTACSCLLTPTTSTTSPGPTQCLASNNYGYIYDYHDFDLKSQYVFYAFPQIAARGDCCRRCLSTPNCYSFAEGNYSGTPETFYCQIGTVQPGPWVPGPDVSAECPLGRLDEKRGPLPAQPSGSPEGAGPGPCGIFQ